MAKTASWFTVSLVSLAAVSLTLAGCNQPQETAEKSPAPQTAAKPESTFRVVENIKLEPGPDPMAMVLTTRQPSTESVGSEQIRLNYPTSDKAIVVVTKSGLPDDSITATRTRYEFTSVDGSNGSTNAKQWQLTQVTQQNKCQPNRGSQGWTGDLCN